MPLLNPNNPLNRPIALSNLFWIILVLILLVGNVFFGFKYSAVQKELKLAQATLETQKTNERVLDFAKLFIEKVLKAETEIDFETRLKLENAVRNLDDEEILTQWQKFIESQTKAEAQEEVKNLLEMLVGKIKVQ
jgi:hemerythrin-like domain-containing protein